MENPCSIGRHPCSINPSARGIPRKVTDMEYMFVSAFAFNQPIGSWDTSQVTEHAVCSWRHCVQSTIGSWDLQGHNMSHVRCTSAFNQTRLGHVIRHADMFLWPRLRRSHCGYYDDYMHVWPCRRVRTTSRSQLTVLPPRGCARTTRATPPSPRPTAPPATCTDTLASGSTCQPECDSGYTVSGATSCTDRVLTAATCTAAVASCTTTQYLTGGACASCPDGSVSRGGDSTICYCPENFYRVVDAGAVGGYVCSACDAGQYRGPGDAVPTARRAARRRGASRS